MAKSKHSPALFEVIHQDKRFTDKATRFAFLRLPKWWSKGRNESEAAEADRVWGETHPPVQTSHLPGEVPDSAPQCTIPALERLQQQISLRITYGGAVAGVVILGLLISCAFILGSKMRPSPALGRPSEEILNDPPQPSVLDINKPPAVANESIATGPAVAPRVAQRPTFNEPQRPSTLVVQDENRAVGLNYVVIQSYPEQEEKMAYEAHDALVQGGILCTIEKSLPGYSKNWYSVVGIVGFERTRNLPRYDAYITRIRAVSDNVSAKHTGAGKFKKFDPQPYRWR
jgi:hypothetical protein